MVLGLVRVGLGLVSGCSMFFYGFHCDIWEVSGLGGKRGKQLNGSSPGIVAAGCATFAVLKSVQQHFKKTLPPEVGQISQ